MYPYTVVDAHCDTIGELYRPLELYCNEGHLDIARMKLYEHYMQFFAVWVEPTLERNAAKERCDTIIAQFHRQVERYREDIVQVTNLGQIQEAFQSGKIAALLALEGGGPIGDSLDTIDEFYQKGVRCITLTWNDTNLIATGAGEKRPKFGLTPFGRKAVIHMNRLGILVDVSHASEKTFWDVAECSSAPIIATHSNSKRICGHPRNLTDEQFLQLKKMGGVTGMNLYPLFVTKRDSASIDDVMRHVEHFLSLGGEDNIGLGADFDGIDYALDDLRGVEDVYLFAERMLQRNYPERLVQKILSDNFLRVIGQVCE